MNMLNKNTAKRNSSRSLDPGVVPSIGNFADKREAEEIKDLNVLYNLFPKDSKIRRAAENKLERIKRSSDLQ